MLGGFSTFKIEILFLIVHHFFCCSSTQSIVPTHTSLYNVLIPLYFMNQPFGGGGLNGWDAIDHKAALAGGSPSLSPSSSAPTAYPSSPGTVRSLPPPHTRAWFCRLSFAVVSPFSFMLRGPLALAHVSSRRPSFRSRAPQPRCEWGKEGGEGGPADPLVESQPAPLIQPRNSRSPQPTGPTGQ